MIYILPGKQYISSHTLLNETLIEQYTHIVNIDKFLLPKNPLQFFMG